MATRGENSYHVVPSFEEQLHVVSSPARQVNIRSHQEQPQTELSKSISASQTQPENCGGYECEFVQPPPKAFQTDCSICLQVLHKPHLISCCGHNFCEVCINRIKLDKRNCPLCSSAKFNLMHNKGLERSLKELEVRCTYSKIGCQWTGKLGSLDSHLQLEAQNQLQGCNFVILECGHGCGQQFQRQLLTNHLEACLKRPYSCNYCQKYDSKFDDVINNHWPECKCYPLSCPNQCTPHAIERQYFQDHLNKDCPLAIVNCDFHYAGCEMKLPRKDMPAHLAENIAHLSLLSDMNLKLTEKLLQKDTEIKQLRHGLQEMTVQLCDLAEDQK